MEAIGFGVMAVDETDCIISFLEKPADPPGMPDNPDKALASMGIYVFNTRFLFDQLRRHASAPEQRPVEVMRRPIGGMSGPWMPIGRRISI
jgi:ADP-glucose pyrophosphorylase